MAAEAQDAAAAFRVISGIENDLAMLRDLGWAIVMVAESTTGMEEQFAGALGRMGNLIVERSSTAETRRGEAMSLLYGYAYLSTSQK